MRPSGSRPARLWAVALAAAGCLPAAAQTALPPDEGRVLGTKVPAIVLEDAHGERLDLSSLAGTLVIVSPIYTRCGYTCSTITRHLKAAVETMGGLGDEYRVLTLDFDPKDTKDDLARFARREGLDGLEGWIVARASPEDTRRFLDAMDFRYISLDNGHFVHPNLVAVLTPDLRVGAFAYGTEFDAGGVARALAAARGESPGLVRALAPLWVLLLVAGLAGSAFALAVLVGRRGGTGRTAARAGGEAAPQGSSGSAPPSTIL